VSALCCQSDAAAAVGGEGAIPPLMVSDEALQTAIAELLHTADFATTTPGVVRGQLEKRFGVSLLDKKDAIREMLGHAVTAEVARRAASGGGANAASATKKSKRAEEQSSGSDSDSDSGDSSDGASSSESDGAAEGGEEAPVDESISGKRASGGFGRKLQLSTPLSEFFGEVFMTRSEVCVSVLWPGLCAPPSVWLSLSHQHCVRSIFRCAVARACAGRLWRCSHRLLHAAA
jgi:hypothetical protein